MRLRAVTTPPDKVEADVLAVPVYREDIRDGFADDLDALDAATGGAIRRAVEWGEFNIVEHYSALLEVQGLAAPRLLLLNGVRRGRGAWRARRVAATATRRLIGRGVTSMALVLRDGEDADGFAAAAVGARSGSFRPMDYYGRVRDTDAMKRTVEELLLVGADQHELAAAIPLAEAVQWGRELANRSANDLYPERMAEEARALEADGCTVEVLDVEAMQALGMNALLGVGLSSVHEPRLIAIKLPGWETADPERRLAIVGKGVCFDSGGISIKPAAQMEEMKHDKCGAAAVIAAARAVAQIAPQTPLMAVAPMVENLPSGTAQRPGDVVRAMNGKTIEVTNTDAEGRLILADALHWAEQQGATHLVDIATLTGAASVAFGELISCYFSRPLEWGEAVQAAADATGEWFWEMPLAVEYRPAYDSAYADIVNSASREGSLIKSAVFIADFVTKPWVHVDIAGSAYTHADKASGAKGATGAGITTLARLAMDFAKGA